MAGVPCGCNLLIKVKALNRELVCNGQIRREIAGGYLQPLCPPPGLLHRMRLAPFFSRACASCVRAAKMELEPGEIPTTTQLCTRTLADLKVCPFVYLTDVDVQELACNLQVFYAFVNEDVEELKPGTTDHNQVRRGLVRGYLS